MKQVDVKVCIVADSNNPRNGGLGRHVHELSERLKEEVDLTVLCRDAQEIQGAEAVEVSGGLKGYGSVPEMYRYIKEEDFDVVHCHGIPGLAGLLAKKRGLDFKLVYTVHGIAYELISREYLRPLAKLVHLPERLAVKAADEVIAVSENTSRETVRHYGIDSGKITTVYNGVDTDKFRPSAEQEQKLLFVGYFIERKGPLQVMKAFNRLSEDFTDLELAMVGQGRLEEDLRDYAEENDIDTRVNFLSGISDERLVELYSESVFVMPSKYEGQGIVYVEAMSCGSPAIGCDNSAIPEMIEDGVNGFLVDRDPEDIAEKIRGLLQDPEKRSSMGEEARKTALDFDWDGIAEETLEIYRKSSSV